MSGDRLPAGRVRLLTHAEDSPRARGERWVAFLTAFMKGRLKAVACRPLAARDGDETMVVVVVPGTGRGRLTMDLAAWIAANGFVTMRAATARDLRVPASVWRGVTPVTPLPGIGLDSAQTMYDEVVRMLTPRADGSVTYDDVQLGWARPIAVDGGGRTRLFAGEARVWLSDAQPRDVTLVACVTWTGAGALALPERMPSASRSWVWMEVVGDGDATHYLVDCATTEVLVTRLLLARLGFGEAGAVR